jgi:hypothetical protein
VFPETTEPLCTISACRVPGLQRLPHRRSGQGQEVVAPALDRCHLLAPPGLPWRGLPFYLVSTKGNWGIILLAFVHTYIRKRYFVNTHPVNIN